MVTSLPINAIVSRRTCVRYGVRLALTIVLASVNTVAYAQDRDWHQTQGLDDGRQWFEKRVRPSSTSSEILRAAEAVAFNRPAAVKLLRKIINSRPRSNAAHQAYGLLSRVYLRTGQYKRLLENLDAWAATFPDREEVKRERKDIEQFRGLPDQVNGPRRPSTLHHDGGIVVPVVVNGKPSHFFFDTGAWVSVVTESESARLGLESRGASGALADSSGGSAAIRLAVAKELTLGSMRFRNVSFAVMPDQQNSVKGEPAVGIMGMPILLAAGTIHWSKNGTAEFGRFTDSKNAAHPNLVFYRNRLLLRANIMGRPVFGTFDTGAVSTDLNSNFATEFADYVQRTGIREKQSITGVGGTSSTDGIRLPEVLFDISGVKSVLRPANVSMQRYSALGGDCCVGNIGLDVLMTAPAFTIDFLNMTLRLDR